MEDSQFLTTNRKLCKAIIFSLLWVTKELSHMIENKMFCVLFKMDLRMVINQKTRLSPSLFMEYQCIADFKEKFDEEMDDFFVSGH